MTKNVTYDTQCVTLVNKETSHKDISAIILIENLFLVKPLNKKIFDLEINNSDSVFYKLTFNNKEYSLSPVGAAAQELIIIGGLENWVKSKL